MNTYPTETKTNLVDQVLFILPLLGGVQEMMGHIFKQNTHCHIISVNTDALMISLLMKNVWQQNTV